MGSRRRTGSPKHREDDWNEEERGNSSKEQAAYDCPAEGRVLLSPVSESKGHGDHADDHGKCRHHYRAQTCCTSLESSPKGIFVDGEVFVGERDNQYAV